MVKIRPSLWACNRAATRREIASHLPPECHWADSTLLNFLLRLEKKNFVRTEKQGNKNLYTPLVRRLTYCGAVSQAHLQTLYDGDIRAMVRALADTPKRSGEPSASARAMHWKFLPLPMGRWCSKNIPRWWSWANWPECMPRCWPKTWAALC